MPFLEPSVRCLKAHSWGIYDLSPYFQYWHSLEHPTTSGTFEKLVISCFPDWLWLGYCCFQSLIEWTMVKMRTFFISAVRKRGPVPKTTRDLHSFFFRNECSFLFSLSCKSSTLSTSFLFSPPPKSSFDFCRSMRILPTLLFCAKTHRSMFFVHWGFFRPLLLAARFRTSQTIPAHHQRFERSLGTFPESSCFSSFRSESDLVCCSWSLIELVDVRNENFPLRGNLLLALFV
jgi:hypothetical protein